MSQRQQHHSQSMPMTPSQQQQQQLSSSSNAVGVASPAAASAATTAGASATAISSAEPAASAAAAAATEASVDLQSVRRLLAECGVSDYEPAVAQQLVDFMYRYCTDLLDDARAYAQHAGKKTLDVEDLRLAVACHGDLDLVSPPPRELLSEVAQTKNAQPLPPIKTYAGVRLPPEKFCLTQPNYKAKQRRAEARSASRVAHQQQHLQHPMVASPAQHLQQQRSSASQRAAAAVFSSPTSAAASSGGGSGAGVGGLKRRYPDAD